MILSDFILRFKTQPAEEEIITILVRSMSIR